MKMKGAKAVHYDSGPNMTPLVDVVMVILIFLMLAGSFGATTHFLMSKAGIKKTGGPPIKLPPGTPPDIDLDLTIENNGPGFVAHINGSQPITDPDKLAQVLSSKLKAFLATGQNIGHLEILLHPAKNVKYQYVVQVYQAALQAFQANNQKDNAKVAFATTS